MLHIGETIAEFREAGEADGTYTNKIKRMMLVMGRIPGEGGWKIIVLNDTGFTDEIPEKDIQKNDGRYITGGLSIVMHAAGMPEESIQGELVHEFIKGGQA